MSQEPQQVEEQVPDTEQASEPAEGRYRVHCVRCRDKHVEEELAQALNRLSKEGEIHTIIRVGSVSSTDSEYLITVRRPSALLNLLTSVLSSDTFVTTAGASADESEDEEPSEDTPVMSGLKPLKHYFPSIKIGYTAFNMLSTANQMLGQSEKTMHDRHARTIVQRYMGEMTIDERAMVLAGLGHLQGDMPDHTPVCSTEGCNIEGVLEFLTPYVEEYHRAQTQ